MELSVVEKLELSLGNNFAATAAATSAASDGKGMHLSHNGWGQQHRQQ